MLPSLSNYTILPFKFIVISTTEDNPRPWVYEIYPDNWIEEINDKASKQMNSLDDILDNYKWVIESKEFYYPAEMVATGFIEL